MPPKEFTFPTSEDLTSARARTMLNIELGANKERTHVYKRWSEKATIVKYNANNDTYNIIVSALNVSSATQKSNRVIRDVKAILPSSTHQFNPGDSVLIGYETDKRESPVILGLRKGSGSQTSAGGGGGGVATPSITPPCDLRALDDDGNVLTSGESIICDCTEKGAAGTMGCCVRVECAVGNVHWAWTGQNQCGTTLGCFSSSIEEKTNSRKFCIVKGICTHEDPSTGSPYTIFQAASALVRCFRFDSVSGGGSCMSGCNISYFNCDGDEIGAIAKISFCAFGGDCRGDQPVGPVADCCVNPALVHESTYGSEVSNIAALIPSCGSEAQDPPVTANDLADRCGWFEYQEEGQNVELETSAAVLTSMRANGCCPCTISDGTSITARDATGRSIIINVKVQVTGEETILQEGDSGFEGACTD
jgi:hypothetical protein